MTKTPIILALVAAAALAGCDQSDHTINANGPDDSPAANASAAPVVLPPAIVASKIYRCKDNSVVYIDWLAGDQAANFRAAQGDTPIQLKAEAAGGALVAEGYSLIGLATAKTITLTRPGIGQKACHA